MNINKRDKNFLTPTNVESQEHLSIERLNLLLATAPTQNIDIKNRPVANFIDLMKWTEKEFGPFLARDTNTFIHNRIVVDGQFMQFCQERNISINCLYKDSIVSWKTDLNFEKFFVQGVFLIKTKGLEFIHAALFHKGNQNEDEISFFVIVPNANYEAYLKLRNDFDEWTLNRDRGNLHIRVVDGQDIPYTKESPWTDLFLPEDMKTELKNLVEGFLASKNFYTENKIPWKRGVLLHGLPGNGKTSIIRTLISEYNFKPITISSGATDDSIREAFSYAEVQSPSLLYFEDLDSLFEKGVDISTFLNLMDGIAAKNGLLVLATANDIKNFEGNITDRPSRFDRKFEIPLPNQEMAYIYLKRWFGNLLTVTKCKELARTAQKYEFSYAYLKELYISSMFEGLAHNRKIPTVKDIQTALNRLIKDKNGKSISTDKYFK